MVKDFISERYSPFAFSDQAVPEDELTALFEAARWAPSSFNEQPWRFVYARNDGGQDFQIMVSILNETNQEWARHAPILGISIAKTTFTLNNKPNRFALHDTGLAMGGLLAQATAMGLKVHQMGGYSMELARKRLAIPEGFEPVAMFVIGFPGDPGWLTQELRQKSEEPRIRRPLNQTVFINRFDSQA